MEKKERHSLECRLFLRSEDCTTSCDYPRNGSCVQLCLTHKPMMADSFRLEELKSVLNELYFRIIAHLKLSSSDTTMAMKCRGDKQLATHQRWNSPVSD